MLRVAMEGRGVIGYVDVTEGATLANVRSRIGTEIDNAPGNFQFILDVDTPVSTKQEATKGAALFFPCITIRKICSPAKIAGVRIYFSCDSAPVCYFLQLQLAVQKKYQ